MFNFQNYEKKFRTNPDVVFCTLFGIEMGKKEMELQGFQSRLFQKRNEKTDSQLN